MLRLPRFLIPVLLLPAIVAAVLVTAPSSAAAIESGRDATVHADGDCLRMRSTPGTAGVVLTCLADGTTVAVLPASQEANGFTWRFISVNGQTGWVVEQYLSQSSGTPPAATQPPAATPASEVITGILPTFGGGAVIVWGGGSLDSLVGAAGRGGCDVGAVWVTNSSGTFVGNIVGAPAFVNADWAARYPGDLPSRSPYVLVCYVGAATEATATPPAPSDTPSLSGNLPAAGGFGLVVWSGGSPDALVSNARTRGCDTASVWTNNDSGKFISYIAGAPALVNAEWAARFGGDTMPGDSAVVVVCLGRSAPPSTASGPVGAAGLPDGIPNLPPGPAGNQ